jgi:hypothetical protein
MDGTVIVRETQVFCRAEHPVRHDSPNAPFLEFAQAQTSARTGKRANSVIMVRLLLVMIGGFHSVQFPPPVLTGVLRACA